MAGLRIERGCCSLFAGTLRQFDRLRGICKCAHPVGLALQIVTLSAQILAFENIGLGSCKRDLLYLAKLVSLSLAEGRLRMRLPRAFENQKGSFVAGLTLASIEQNLLVAAQLVDLAREVVDFMLA